jgi:hypothetical protein
MKGGGARRVPIRTDARRGDEGEAVRRVGGKAGPPIITPTKSPPPRQNASKNTVSTRQTSATPALRVELEVGKR